MDKQRLGFLSAAGAEGARLLAQAHAERAAALLNEALEHVTGQPARWLIARAHRAALAAARCAQDARPPSTTGAGAGAEGRSTDGLPSAGSGAALWLPRASRCRH